MDNAMVKHKNNHHHGLEPNFNFNVHRVWKSSLARQIGEAICIGDEDQALLMNSRSDWGQNPIPRVTPAPEQDQDNPNPGGEANTNPNPAKMPILTLMPTLHF